MKVRTPWIQNIFCITYYIYTDAEVQRNEQYYNNNYSILRLEQLIFLLKFIYRCWYPYYSSNYYWIIEAPRVAVIGVRIASFFFFLYMHFGPFMGLHAV